MREHTRILPTPMNASAVGDPIVGHLPDIERAEPRAMKVRCPDRQENNELMAIAALRDALQEGAEVVEGSWQASWVGYIVRAEPYTAVEVVGEWWVASVLVWPFSMAGEV